MPVFDYFFWVIFSAWFSTFIFLYKAEKISFLVCVYACARACVCGAVNFARLCYSWSNVARWMLLFSLQM